MNTFKKVLLPIVILSIALSLGFTMVGCHHKTTVTNVPAGVSPNEVLLWHDAVDKVHAASVMVRTTTDALVQMHSVHLASGAPVVPDEQYAIMLNALGHIAQGARHADNLLQQTPNSFDKSVQLQLDGVVSEVGVELAKIPTEFNVSEPAVTNFVNQVTQMRAAIQLVYNLVKSQ